MVVKKTHIYLLLIIFPFFVNAQIQEKQIGLWLIEANYSLQYPSGDIAERYGLSNTIGLGVTYKTKSNWTLGLEGNYLFGGDLKQGSSILDNLKTESGQIINRYGEYATVSLSQRGFFGAMKFGKIIPVFGPNPNSGIMLTFSAGWLHHHIRIENKDNNTPPVLGDYKIGYDRLTGGPAMRQFIGYQYLGNNETVNFYFGFEFYQARTKSLRAYNFDTMTSDDSIYNDFLYAFRFGWILPIYSKEPKKFYHH